MLLITNCISNIVSTIEKCPTKKPWSYIKGQNEIFVVLVHYMWRVKHLLILRIWQMLFNCFFTSVFIQEYLSSWPDLNNDSSFPDMPPILY